MTLSQELTRHYILQDGNTLTIPRTLAEKIIETLEMSSAPDVWQQHIEPGEQLTPKESVIMACLTAHINGVTPTAKLLAASNIKKSNSLWVHVYRIREKIKDTVEIDTVNRRGYILREVKS